MGTSASSNGPNKGVPFDPPWLDDIELPITENTPDNQENPTDQAAQPSIAPARRFQSARRFLGDYARSGDHESLRKAVGHYSRDGMGGAGRVARRMRLSTRSATALIGFLQSIREGANAEINEWVSSLVSRSATTNEITDEILTKVAPQGGSVDETSCRMSMEQAITKLASTSPDINLLKLSDDNIWAIIKWFLSYEAYKRLCFDIGQTFEKSSLPSRDRVIRMNEMQRYIEAEIFAQIEDLRHTGNNAPPSELNQILQQALKNTFLVYEGSI